MRLKRVRCYGFDTKYKYAKLDDDVYKKLVSMKLAIRKKKNIHVSLKKHQILHYLIVEKRGGLEVDHINRDVFDNRRENLRYCTRSQNEMNKGLNVANSSGYKGVCGEGGKWRAQIKFRRNNLHLGMFLTKKEAAKAYNEKAKELYGEFAWLNPV
jgi:hypothetical protein